MRDSLPYLFMAVACLLMWHPSHLRQLEQHPARCGDWRRSGRCEEHGVGAVILSIEATPALGPSQHPQTRLHLLWVVFKANLQHTRS